MCRPLNAAMMESTPSEMAAVVREYMPHFVLVASCLNCASICRTCDRVFTD